MNLGFYGIELNNKVSSVSVKNSRESTILLDCGVDPKNPDKLIFPKKLVKNINAIFITHAHRDHWGALPNLLRKKYENKIYMTPPTHEILKKYSVKAQFSFLQKDQKDNYANFFHQMEDLIIEKEYGELISVEDFKIYFIPANHILGSAQILIFDKDSRKQILYTGDFNPGKNYLFDDLEIENIENKYNLEINPDFVIMECSNIDQNEESFKKEEKKFINRVNKTYENMGNVLIPAKAIGNAQEFLIRYLTYCLEDRIMMPNEIFTSGSLTEINNIYYKYIENFRDPSLINLLREKLVIKNFQDYIGRNFDGMEDLFFENEYNFGIKLFIATGGNLKGGSSKRIYNKLQHKPKNLIIMPKVHRKLNCKAEVLNLSIFSLHGGFKSIKDYIREIENRHKKKSIYFLIHGYYKNLEKMKKYLDLEEIESIIPKVGDKYKGN